MSFITWQTPKGQLGTVSENTLFEKDIVAVDSSGLVVSYEFLSGQLPTGIQVVKEGKVSGVPQASRDGAETGASYTFAVRASSASGAVADRTFTITVSNIVSPILLPFQLPSPEIFDGKFYQQSFSALDVSNAKFEYTINDGELPPGLTLTTDGLLSGYPTLNVGTGLDAVSGYDKLNFGAFPYDRPANRPSKTFNFSVQVSDGLKSSIRQYSLTVIRKSSYTGDTDFITSDNNYLRISEDNKYVPVILNPEGTILTVRQNDNFSYRFVGYHPADEEIAFLINNYRIVGFDDPFSNFDIAQFDQGDQGLFPGATLNYSSGWLHGIAPAQTEALRIYSFNVVVYNKFQPWVVGPEKTFNIVVLGDLYNSITWNTPNDLGTLAEGQPCTLQVNATSSNGSDIVYTLEGNPELVATLETTNGIRAGMSISGVGILPGAKVVKILDDRNIVTSIYLKNETGEYLTFSQGSLSITVRFIQASKNIKSLPQGVRLTSDGLLVGRPSFRKFTVDSEDCTVTLTTTTGIQVGMDVTGPTAVSGCKVDEILGPTTLRVSPSVVAAAGSFLTFSQGNTQITRVLTAANRSTTISDEGLSSFDALREFTVRATALDGSASSTRTFRLRLANFDLAPYENLYLKALPPRQQRQKVVDLWNDSSIFPDELIYRPNDPWFGKPKDIKVLLLPGLAPSSLSKYIESIQVNHHNKKIRFGGIKTAIAVDRNFQTKYEVVYVEVLDDQRDINDISKELIDMSKLYSNWNPYQINGQEYSIIYPNSFPNMRNKVGATLGFENRGTLPDWMVSPQDDKNRAVDPFRVIGFTPAAVLCYTVPGGANIIKYRLEQSGFQFNEINFVADRYQLDNGLSKFFNTETNRFLLSRQTTFDYVTQAGQVDANVDYAVETTFESINYRTVDYIKNVLGGIDRVIDFEDGDTLIFAKQELYAGPQRPYDGWYLGTDPYSIDGYDSWPLDALEVIPGYQNKVPKSTETVSYSQSGNTVICVFFNHNLSNGSIVNIGVASGNAVNGSFAITVIDENQFFYVATNSQTTSGLVVVTPTGARQGTYVQENTNFVIVTLPNHTLGVSQIVNVSLDGNESVAVPIYTIVDENTFVYRADTVESTSGTITISVVNQRASVWTIRIIDNVVRLLWTQEIELTQRIRVSRGTSYGGSILVYDPLVKPGNTVPDYTVTIQTNAASAEKTTFDGNGTRFIEFRDIYAKPEVNDKYLKFPKIGVFT